MPVTEALSKKRSHGTKFEATANNLAVAKVAFGVKNATLALANRWLQSWNSGEGLFRRT